MNILTRTLNVVALSAAAVMAASAAQAETMTIKMHPSMHETRSMTVSYGDLNLSKEAGIHALYQRLRQATDRVCAPKHESGGVGPSRDWLRCQKSALDSAVMKVGHPRLSEIHYNRTHRLEDAVAESVSSR